MALFASSSPRLKPFASRLAGTVAATAMLVCGWTATQANTSPAAPASPKVNAKMSDTAGVMRELPIRGSKATVLVFISHDCPISNAYAPEISRIANEYGKRDVQLMVVYAEHGLSSAKAREHAKAYGYRVPTIIDATHRLSKTTGATVTPEAVVLAPDGHRLYMGRIDNLYAGYGKKRKQATERDLRAALDATLAGKPVPNPTTTALGCFIPNTTP